MGFAFLLPEEKVSEIASMCNKPGADRILFVSPGILSFIPEGSDKFPLDRNNREC